jgi:hypothetical protein
MKGALLIIEKWTKDRASLPQMAGIGVAVQHRCITCWNVVTDWLN